MVWNPISLLSPLPVFSPPQGEVADARAALGVGSPPRRVGGRKGPLPFTPAALERAREHKRSLSRGSGDELAAIARQIVAAEGGGQPGTLSGPNPGAHSGMHSGRHAGPASGPHAAGAEPPPPRFFAYAAGGPSLPNLAAFWGSAPREGGRESDALLPHAAGVSSAPERWSLIPGPGQRWVLALLFVLTIAGVYLLHAYVFDRRPMQRSG